jgi:hypothetical protein
MRRAWAVGAAVFASFILIIAVVNYRSTHPQVPPALEAKNCASTAALDELPNARFVRKGGRTTRYVRVWREGTALTVDKVAQGRDLRRYDRLELADPEPRAVADRRGDWIIAKARKFLWEHWRDRKRAYLLLTLSSVDATSTSHIFVEKDEIGRWRVYWRIVRDHSEIDDLPTTYAVQWVTPVHDWDTPGTPLAQGVEPDPLRHRLEFRDVCGDVEGLFW